MQSIHLVYLVNKTVSYVGRADGERHCPYTSSYLLELLVSRLKQGLASLD